MTVPTKRGRIHSRLLIDMFPNQRPTGIDLGDIEIKESHTIYHRIVLHKKDMDKRIKFFLCYNHLTEEFLIVDSQDLRPIKRTSTFHWKGLKKFALILTKEYEEVYYKVDELSEFKDLINPYKN